jgi:hypothetical protein
MSTVQWIVVAAFEVLVVLTIREVLRLWRGEGKRFAGWSVDFLRILPALSLAVMLMNLIALVALFAPTDRVNALSFVVVMLLLLFGVVVVMLATLWFFGRPAALVPPHLRGRDRREEYRPRRR